MRYSQKTTQRHEMPEITLILMTRELCRQYYQGFISDPDIYVDMSAYKPFHYSDEWADAYFDRQLQKKRLYFAVMQGANAVGEIILKDMDSEKAQCTLSIHLQSDDVKGKGIGSKAEQLILEYAFLTLHMKVVLADAVQKNKRSQHVLEKVGFQYVRQDEMFKYYEMRRETYIQIYLQPSP